LQGDAFPDLQDVFNALTKDEARCSASWEKAQLYELGPWEFLSFARQDLEEGSERGLLNGISNASRAIACRVDEILTLANLRPFVTRERWSLPYKLEVIKKLGCPAPNVLRGYITSIRNVLEHEYKRPPELAQIRYVADIAELFLSATDEFVGRGYMRSAEVVVEHEERAGERERWKETRVFPGESFALDFEVEIAVLKLSYSQFERINVWNRRTTTLSEQKRRLGEPIMRTLRLDNCNKQQLVDLVRVLREKSTL